jgi:hypothetical protein
MLSLMDSASLDEAIDVALCDDVIRNQVWSPCGRFESFDINGYHCVVDWNEIDPPGTDYDAPGIPWEQVEEEMRLLFEELDRGQ